MRRALLDLAASDAAVRHELESEGVLQGGYHPRMEAVHRENAAQLRVLLAQYGWPNELRAGVDGAEAAWLIAQHAIGEPVFMRECRDRLAEEVDVGHAPKSQLAYLDDRVRVFEGRPQRFGTQFEITPDGPRLFPVEDPQHLDRNRQDAGLGPVAARLASAQDAPRPTAAEFAAQKADERRWRAGVGWISADDT
ncbi:MAG: DUF6624 domain-containing protein [Silanimonas sp.]